MAASLKWYDSNVKRTMRKAAQAGIVRVAFDVRSQARRNLTTNGQNDTKFLWNSIYVATPEKVSPVPPDRQYLSSKTGRMVSRERGPIVQPAEGAYVGAAASYAVYPELENSYLYRAITEVAGRRAEDAMVGLQTGLYVSAIGAETQGE